MSSVQSWVTQQDNTCFGCGRLEFKISCWWPWKLPNTNSIIFIFNLLYDMSHKSWEIHAVLCPQGILRGWSSCKRLGSKLENCYWHPSSVLCVGGFPQHFQKYLLLQREQRRTGKGSWGRARRDLHSCSRSYCFVSVELIKWINCRHIFFSGNAFPSAVVMVESGKKKSKILSVQLLA